MWLVVALGLAGVALAGTPEPAPTAHQLLLESGYACLPSAPPLPPHFEPANEAQMLAERGDHAAAADEYLCFIKRFPDSAYINLALYNAGNQFDLAGDATQAIALFERYVTAWPDDVRSHELFFRIADLHASLLDMQGALAWFTRLYTEFPDHLDAANAMYNAAFLSACLGDHADAAGRYELYATRFPDRPDAEDTFWWAAEQWELVSEASALRFYRQYLTRFESSPSHSIQALGYIARAQERAGDRAGAASTWSRLNIVFHAVDPASLSSGARRVAAWHDLDLLDAEVQGLNAGSPMGLQRVDDRAARMVVTYALPDSTAAASLARARARFKLVDLGVVGDLAAEGRQILLDELDHARVEKSWSAVDLEVERLLGERSGEGPPHMEARGMVNPAP